MLSDPFGDRMVPGAYPKRGEGRVSYLEEVCDPPESAEFPYTVNDVLVSDFITPAFYDPVKATGVRYSFTGATERPRQVLEGGYISWRNQRNEQLRSAIEAEESNRQARIRAAESLRNEIEALKASS